MNRQRHATAAALAAVLLFLLCSVCAQAQSLLLAAWDFRRTARPPPISFVLTLTTAQFDLQTVTVPPVAAEACTQAPAWTPDTFCARLECPAPGLYQFTVQAQFAGGELSDPAPPVLCLIQAEATVCTCIPGVLTEQPPPPTQAVA